MKRLFSAFFALFFAVSLLAIPSLASENAADYTIYYDDGSYAIVTLSSSIARSSTRSDKTYTYYDSQGSRCFFYLLSASFTYDGTTSRADSCHYSSEIYRHGWTMTTHSEYVSGNTAYGNAVYSGPNGSVPVHLTMTCDRNGNVT